MKPKDLAIPLKGEMIRITDRLCGKLQPDVAIGKIYLVAGRSKTKSGQPVLLLSDKRKKSKTTRVNPQRFRWETVTEVQLAEEKLREDSRHRAKELHDKFTRKEQCQIAIVPLIYNHIAWHFAQKAMELAATYKVSLLKRLTRTTKQLRQDYRHELLKDLRMLCIDNLEKQSDKFLASHDKDVMTFWFSVNREFKKKMPDYPYDDLRTWAIMSVITMKVAEEHNRMVDKLVAGRTGTEETTIRMTIMSKLYDCMNAMAGEVGKFDYGEYNVGLCRRILKNNIAEIDFEFL